MQKSDKRKIISNSNGFLSAIITLVIVLTMTFTFLFGISTLKEYKKQIVNNNQIIVYINDLTDDQKTEFSKTLLEEPGVSSVRYESKEVALKAVATELRVDLDDEENPLSDAFYVYLKPDVQLEKLKASLLNMDQISAVDFRTKAIQSTINFYNSLERITIKSIVVILIFGLIMIYNIIKFSVISKRKEIHESLAHGTEIMELKKLFFIENLTQLVISTVISFVIYEYIKANLIEVIKSLSPSFVANISIWYEILVALGIFIVALVISYLINFFSMNKYFVEYKNDNDECYIPAHDLSESDEEVVLYEEVGEEENEEVEDEK